jgi:hypothetical protein
MTKEKSKADKDQIKKTTKKKVAKKAKPRAAKPKTAKPRTSKLNKQVTPEERLEMIRTAAYFLAEKRGHHGNNELGDWFEAEKEIDSLNGANY